MANTTTVKDQNILLTSQGLCNSKIRRAFVKLTKKKASQIRVLAVTIKETKKRETRSIKSLKKQFSKTGIKKFTIINLEKNISYKELQAYDALYMNGGNTFFIMNRIRKKRFDKAIRKFVQKGKVYIGGSAGALIMCPRIDLALVSKYVYDENKIGLTNMRGLAIVSYEIMPHVNANVRREISTLKKQFKQPILLLTDSEAVIFTSKSKYRRI